MSFVYSRIIRFQDTDAAGVVYFANVLSICHEAYEASLVASEIDLRQFFTQPAIAIPISHASIDFFRPMYCGERYGIHLTPKLMNESKFEINYELFRENAADDLIGKALTKHVCIHAIARTKINIPTEIHNWLQRWS
jgi:1,4-dihydroxy-2-naphthoyl-CoA hydrolase